jgi:uncharacterized protein (DUF1919 family)
MKFSEAIEALKLGKRITREGWNTFIFMQVPSEINREIVPKMQSLPQSVKDEFERRFNDPEQQINTICYNDQFVIVHPDNMIVGWSPSSSDVLAKDWIILD